MNLRNDFIKVVAEFFYAYLLLGRYENAGSLFLRNPTVLEFFQRAVCGLFWLKGEFVVGLVGIGINLIENHVAGLVCGADVPESLFHNLHLLLKIRVGDVHHVHKYIGLPYLIKGALEGLYKLSGEFTDKAYCVTEEERYVLYHNLSYGGVQGGKEFVLRKHVRFGQ